VINKKQIRLNIKKLQHIKTWQLFILLILMIFVAATFLRLNNIGMVQRRAAVLSADEAGDEKVIKERLYELQLYVTSHMNADLGKGLYLEASYKRASQAAYDSVETDSKVYQLAQETCAPKFASWSQAYVQCTANELAKYPGTATPTLPDTSAYLHVYASPLWSPDFAGWTALICLALLIMVISRVLGYLILKMLLKYRHKGI
jgi:hypothetical protein